ncbi:MAG: hypothetical protein ACMUIP_02380, partial [bacterium]
QARRHETIAMRLRQEGNSSEGDIRENEALAESYRMLLEEHKLDAANETYIIGSKSMRAIQNTARL